MIQIADLGLVMSESPKCWRFIVPNEDASENEELVLSLQGIISHKDLPPILRRCVSIFILMNIDPTFPQSWWQKAGLHTARRTANRSQHDGVQEMHRQHAYVACHDGTPRSWRFHRRISSTQLPSVPIHRSWDTLFYSTPRRSSRRRDTIRKHSRSKRSVVLHGQRYILSWDRQWSALLCFVKRYLRHKTA